MLLVISDTSDDDIVMASSCRGDMKNEEVDGSPSDLTSSDILACDWLSLTGLACDWFSPYTLPCDWLTSCQDL